MGKKKSGPSVPYLSRSKAGKGGAKQVRLNARFGKMAKEIHALRRDDDAAKVLEPHLETWRAAAHGEGVGPDGPGGSA